MRGGRKYIVAYEAKIVNSLTGFIDFFTLKKRTFYLKVPYSRISVQLRVGSSP